MCEMALLQHRLIVHGLDGVLFFSSAYIFRVWDDDPDDLRRCQRNTRERARRLTRLPTCLAERACVRACAHVRVKDPHCRTAAQVPAGLIDCPHTDPTAELSGGGGDAANECTIPNKSERAKELRFRELAPGNLFTLALAGCGPAIPNGFQTVSNRTPTVRAINWEISIFEYSGGAHRCRRAVTRALTTCSPVSPGMHAHAVCVCVL